MIAQSPGAVEYTDCFSAEEVNPHPNECPGYDNKQSDGEYAVMLELWGIWSTPSLPLLPGPFWPGVVALDRVLSTRRIELNSVFMLNLIGRNRTVLTSKLRIYAKPNCFKWEWFWMLNCIVWNSTVFDS